MSLCFLVPSGPHVLLGLSIAPLESPTSFIPRDLIQNRSHDNDVAKVAVSKEFIGAWQRLGSELGSNSQWGIKT